MRICHLLQKGEYLEFARQLSKGLRIELIDYVCNEQQLIRNGEHLRLIH